MKNIDSFAQLISNNIKRILICLIFIYNTIIIQSKNSNNNNHYIFGTIVDFVTSAPVIDTTTVYLSYADSSVISACFTTRIRNGNSLQTPFRIPIKKDGNYILIVENKHYNTLYYPISIIFHKRETAIDLGRIPMKKKMENILNDVEVNATQVKFYFNEDTLVYNANMFLTQKGFVLNDILMKMPGIFVHPNGEIYINGRRIDALLLNGKDFFNSDRKTLLSNLPAYTVKNVKIYEKSKDSTSLIKREREFEGYVMDLKLKKEYQSATIGNVDLAYGSNSRYYAKLFGMKYSSFSRLSTYAIANNINKDEMLTLDGQSRNLTNGNGDNNYVNLGIAYNKDHFKGSYSLNGTTIATYKDKFSSEKIANKYFVNQNKIFSRSSGETNLYSLSIQSNHSFYLLGNTMYDFTLTPYFSCEKRHGTIHGYNVSTNNDIDNLWGDSWEDSLKSQELTQALKLYGINKASLNQKNNASAYQYGFEVRKEFRIPHTNDKLYLNGKYNYHSILSNIYNQRNVNYILNNSNSWINQYDKNKTKDWQNNIKITYLYNFIDYNSIYFEYEYDYSNLTNNKSLYSLHKLAGWNSISQSPIGILPSQELLLDLLDSNNSYSYTQNNYIHKYELKYQYLKEQWPKKTEFSIGIPMYLDSRKLSFNQLVNDTIINVNKLYPNIIISYYHTTQTHKHSYITYSLQYKYSVTLPSLYNLVNYKNDANPLIVSNGNPNLKNVHSHNGFGQFFWQSSKGYIQRMNFNYTKQNNKIANSLIIDEESGTTIITPYNVNGNWQLNLNIANSLYVKSNRHYSINNELALNWNNNVDYIRTNSETNNNKSIVKNRSITEKIILNWISENTKIRISGNTYVTYSKSLSTRKDFKTLELYNYGIQSEINIELPKNYRLHSDLLTVSRSGYNVSNLNNQEYIFNIELSKNISERFTLTIEGYDLLNQRKNVYHYVNGQGSTSVFYNNLHRYLMLHFIMRLDKGRQHHGHIH